MITIPKMIRDANFEMVPYDGSPVEWRISVYGIVIENDELLMLRHKEEKLWDIPGGGIEFGESIPEALDREAHEEVGWTLSPINPLWSSIDWFYHNSDKKFYRAMQQVWLAEGHVVGEPTDPRTKTVKMVPLTELSQYDMYPSITDALKMLGV